MAKPALCAGLALHLADQGCAACTEGAALSTHWIARDQQVPCVA
jgi:hypothetical protein